MNKGNRGDTMVCVCRRVCRIQFAGGENLIAIPALDFVRRDRICQVGRHERLKIAPGRNGCCDA